MGIKGQDVMGWGVYKERELLDEKREKNSRRTENQSKNSKRKRVNSVLSSVRALTL